MKSGRFVKLNKEKNILLSYGSVNSKKLKSIFLRLQCWVEPKEDDDKNWDGIINKMRRDVRMSIYNNINEDLFSKNYIVDLDLRSSGILSKKRSFMSCEITLYPKKQCDIKSDQFSGMMFDISQKVIKSSKTLFEEFTIFERKR